MRMFGVIVIALFLAFLSGRMCMQKVPLGWVGVKVNKMGGGIVPKDLQPGYHVVIPGLHELVRMDARKKVEIFMPAGTGVRSEFQLIAQDQYTVGLDISIIYSLEPGMAYKAREKYGEGDKFEVVMGNLAKKVLTEVMGQMTTEDYYDSQKRTAQAEKALQELNRIMHDDATREYLIVHHVLIRGVIYDPTFEKRLLEKQLTDQKQQLYGAKRKTEAELEKTQMIQKQANNEVMRIAEEKTQAIEKLKAETDAQIAKIEADANYYADTLIAGANRDQRERTALGELEKTRAQAVGEKAVNAAYEGFGGQLLLVKKMIDNMQLGQIEINTNRTNPFDVDEMLNMLGAGQGVIDEAAGRNAPRATEATGGQPAVSTTPANPFLEQLRTSMRDGATTGALSSAP